MRRERVLPCAISRFRDLNLPMRTTATQDEPLDGASETIFAIAVSYEIRCPLHLRAGIAHGDAEPTSLEHRDIVAAVADGGNFRQRNTQEPCYL